MGAKKLSLGNELSCIAGIVHDVGLVKISHTVGMSQAERMAYLVRQELIPVFLPMTIWGPKLDQPVVVLPLTVSTQ